MQNKAIADMLEEIASMIELEPGDRHFEVRAYRRAALSIETLQEDVADILRNRGMEGLKEISGVGEGIGAKIKEFIETGKMRKYDELKKKYPVDFKGLTKVQGLGPKKIIKLYRKLGITDLESLKKAISSHRIMKLEGFGEKSEAEMEKALGFLESSKGRLTLGQALPEAESIAMKLRKSKLAYRVEVAGSLRRMRETIGDIDILVISSEPKKVMEFAANLDEVDSVIAMGETKATFWLTIGTSCDIRVVEQNSFGSAMQYFTGSKSHGVKMRQIAIKKGFSLSEYGLFDKKGKAIASESEEEIYKRIGMDYIEPEMRENIGEIELAIKHMLPKLIRYGDVVGDLHVHTTHSDGAEKIEEMASYAEKIGMKYIGISDHSQSEFVAHGMDDAKFMEYFKEIDRLNEKLEGRIRILKSGEVDILKDGSLDLSNKTLDEMDYVLATVHGNRNMDRESMTKRVITALSSGRVGIWAHPTGRLINAREPLQLDLDKIFEVAKDNDVVMEIDAYPDRLDLNDENIRKAKSYGLKFAIDTDAHRASNFDFIRYGIGTARRGWLEKKDVINTMNIERMLKALKANA